MRNYPFEHILLGTLAEHVPHRIYAKDTECRFVFANKAVAIGMGVSGPADLIGRTDFGFYPAQSATQYFEEEQQIMRTGVSMVNHEEHVHYKLSNEDAWMLTTKVPLLDDAGQVIGIAGINYDITDRKAAELTLRDEARRSEENYRNIVEGALEGIFRVSIEGRTLSANPAWARMLGYDSADELTDTVSDVRRQLYVHPQDRDKVMSILLERGYVAGHELELYRKDGTTLWVSLMSRLVRNDAGEVLFIDSFASDVTERRRAEAELKRNQEQLEELVTERTVELTRAKKLAEVANAAKSDFLARMSHELRTPLNAILGYAQIMKMDKALNPGHAKAVATMQRSGEHLLALIDDVLDLAKIEASKLDLVTGVVELQGLLRVIGDITHVKAEQKGLAFASEITPDLPRAVRADERRLQQVLLNLLGNAVKFTERGRVTLRVHRVASASGAVTLRFEISDTGIGIEASHLQRIFQPFEQVGDARQKLGGTGLGLAIAAQLIHAMGSEIHVESRPGEGSLFWFELVLPIATALAAVAPPREVVTGYEGPRKRVLVVDDVLENRAVLRDMLEPLGFELHEAEDGLLALEAAPALAPDLILMDSVMPRLDGLETTRRLRQTSGLSKVPIIMISAGASRTDEAKALAAGADRFLPKPFNARKLLDTVGTLLALKWVYRAIGDLANDDTPTKHRP